jgi:hypothetical protein
MPTPENLVPLGGFFYRIPDYTILAIRSPSTTFRYIIRMQTVESFSPTLSENSSLLS